jgi:hypothetical protein
MDWDWYSVRVEARPGADAIYFTVDDVAADALMEMLEEYDGIVSAGNGSWDVTVSIQAESAWDATVSGAPMIEKFAHKAGMPEWPIVRAEAIRQDVLDAENARPTLPELVSVPEAAEILGVSKQRVHQLAATNASFPEPMYELTTGKLWLRDAIDVFDQRWDRKPGRPRKDQTALSFSHSEPGCVSRPGCCCHGRSRRLKCRQFHAFERGHGLCVAEVIEVPGRDRDRRVAQ